jgi:hypothetical protein
MRLVTGMSADSEFPPMPDWFPDFCRELAALTPAESREFDRLLAQSEARDEAAKQAAAHDSEQPKLRKPTLARVARQAGKAQIAVARYEVRPDGTIVVVTGKSESESIQSNPWLADLEKVTKQ